MIHFTRRNGFFRHKVPEAIEAKANVVSLPENFTSNIKFIEKAAELKLTRISSHALTCIYFWYGGFVPNCTPNPSSLIHHSFLILILIRVELCISLWKRCSSENSFTWVISLAKRISLSFLTEFTSAVAQLFQSFITHNCYNICVVETIV